MPVAGANRQGRRLGAPAALLALLGVLAGCSSANLGGMFETPPPPPPAAAVPAAPTPGGDVYGTGPVKVGMILPLTQNGAPSTIGQSLHNAAQMAVEESGVTDITLSIQDDQSTPAGASQAAQSQLGGGAEILLGPLY
jgi:ABC-type branched-subunit amino acid transport system substrate-binding protein